MNATQRRSAVQQTLLAGNTPISASALAVKFGVSRQIIVGDVALLRAEGCPIIATPRGYLVNPTHNAAHTCALACRHTRAQLLDELYLIVDTGCSVLDVIVEHPVYGQLTGNLSIESRFDADEFWAKLKEEDAAPLCQLTGDVHLHTIAYPSDAALARCEAALAEKGYLLQK